MSMKKQALSDELLDNVTGGTVIPRPSENGETLKSFADRINASASRNVTPQNLILWNNLPATTDPNAPLPAGTVLKVFF
ncbi:MAG: hypothetical protein IKS55_06775 [Oscillospiraceae bacterium]|nr:hypothetical protein [Oscillospiraceae bacterium]